MSSPDFTAEIPDYLEPYTVRQDPSLYTPMDHASWRFVLKIARKFFARHAHQKYLDGLKETGISSERIPLIEEMDEKLKAFGWRAVAVSGFIPPAVFMEFQSLGILPIACDMRTLEHLAYTPAPDIVHEAAGHAPIIADREYSAYLRSYGSLSRNAIYSRQDMDVYNAIRHLSDTKEDPKSTPEVIQAAQARLDQAVASVSYISEATLLSRMGWWTFEYGLVGSMENPKIYGAGLLSSVGESYACLTDNVRKVPFSIDCIHTTYDITKPQPQLFVARDFHQLTDALEELASMMAFRRGGMEGLGKALQAGTVTTTVLDSGIQISGRLTGILSDSRGEPAYLKFIGPTQLACAEKEIPNQGAEYHREGFGTPVGMLQGLRKSPADLSEADLKQLGFGAGKTGKLEFESGIVVEGRLKDHPVMNGGRNMILAFEDCTVRRGPEILFKPEWGTFDMACGSKVVSVFGGAADRRSYLAATGGFHQTPGQPKTNLTEENRALNELYARVRKLRENGRAGANAHEFGTELKSVHEALENKYPTDWLLRFELLELAAQEKLHEPWEAALRNRLEEISKISKEKGELISRGLATLMQT